MVPWHPVENGSTELARRRSVADAARRSLETRLAVVAHTLPLAAHLSEHDIEHVHRLRVATRRAAAALKLYRDWLPQKTRRWFKKRLRQIRRAAGEARDLDVLIQRLQRESVPQIEPIVRFLGAKRRCRAAGHYRTRRRDAPRRPVRSQSGSLVSQDRYAANVDDRSCIARALLRLGAAAAR